MSLQQNGRWLFSEVRSSDCLGAAWFVLSVFFGLYSVKIEP